jgi:predicted 2-oxoglutarate/Fe(II)-dependent dioxygenase YbiX
MNYKIYKNVLDAEFIDYVLNNVDKSTYHQGTAGNKVNNEQKRRLDLHIKSNTILEKIDNEIYDKLYQDVTENFTDIKYREKWKIGFYSESDQGFYNLHTDNARNTKYRKTSIVCMLSEPDEYEGGELYFQKLDKQFKLNKGDVIIFDAALMHGVHPVTKGKRYVLISFFFDDGGLNLKHAMELNESTSKKYIPLLKNLKLEYPVPTDAAPPTLASLTEVPAPLVPAPLAPAPLAPAPLAPAPLAPAPLAPAPLVPRNKGDVDYSDLHQHTWDDTDNYHYEENDSDTLLVLFSGMGWKTSLPTFIFYNFLKSYTNTDKLFLRDVKTRYYLTGIKNRTADYAETIEFYKTLITKKKYKRVIGLGCSAGGYAAILYGLQLQFDKIIAFNPQTVLNDKKESQIQDVYNAPKTCKWLRNLNQQNEPYQKALDLGNFMPFTPPIHIHYSVGGNRGIDKNHAEHLSEDASCTLFEHPGSDHMIALTLRNNGKLKEIIDEALM